MKTKRMLTTALCASLLLVGFSPGVASAAPPLPTGVCSGGKVTYKATYSPEKFTQAIGKNSSVTGGPGVTLGISTSTSFTVGGSITTTTDVSVDAVLATVKVGVGVAVTESKSGTTSTSGSWKVPKSYKVGRLAIGSMKYKGTVARYVENRNCVRVMTGSSARYDIPVDEWHFQRSKVS